MNQVETEIISALKRRPKSGFTTRELEVALKRRTGSVSGRCADLTAKGLVMAAGKRLDELTQRYVTVWRVV